MLSRSPRSPSPRRRSRASSPRFATRPTSRSSPQACSARLLQRPTTAPARASLYASPRGARRAGSSTPPPARGSRRVRHLKLDGRPAGRGGGEAPRGRRWSSQQRLRPESCEVRSDEVEHMHVICGSGGAYSAHVHVASAVVARIPHLVYASFKLNVTSVISRARGTAHQTAHTQARLSLGRFRTGMREMAAPPPLNIHWGRRKRTLSIVGREPVRAPERPRIRGTESRRARLHRCCATSSFTPPMVRRPRRLPTRQPA